MKQLDIIWVAGYLEGEGCFSYGCSPTIRVGSTDCDVIEKLSRILGSKINGPYGPYGKNNKPQYKPFYLTWLNGFRATEWMKLIRPFMGERRCRKIDEILVRFSAAPTKAWKQGTARKTTCHLNRKHYAHGLCRGCYQKELRRKEKSNLISSH